jgi:GxxExxY protein
MNRQGANKDAREARICEYEASLALELSERGISFQRQHSMVVAYKGKVVGQARVDLLVGELVLVELKAVETLLPVHAAQVISYLKATKCALGLLINFNVPVLLRSGVRRLVLTNQNPGVPGGSWRPGGSPPKG